MCLLQDAEQRAKKVSSVQETLQFIYLALLIPHIVGDVPYIAAWTST